MSRFSPARLTRFWRGEGVERGPVALGPRRIYVFPTREGIAFAFVLLALLVGSANYALGLGYALTFFLASLGAASAVAAQRNLARLLLEIADAPPIFAGEKARFPATLRAPPGAPRRAVALKVRGGEPHYTDVDEGGTTLALSRPAEGRGLLPLGRVTVETRWPLGLFRAWSPVSSGATALVYPRPAPPAPLPPPIPGALRGESARPRPGGADEFLGLRGYQPGDPLRAIHWRASAKRETPVVKVFGDEGGGSLLLDFDALSDPDDEARLSRLCRFVLDAEKAELPYALRLPGLSIPAGVGEGHQRHTLAALATWSRP